MPTVMTFLGVSQYGNFNGMAMELGEAYLARGTDAVVVDTRDPAHPDTIRALLQRPDLQAVVTMTGYGLDISETDNLYGETQVPVVSLYFDPLFYYLEQLRAPIPRRLVTTTADTDLIYWQRQPPPPLAVRHLPHAATPQPVRDWGGRTIPLLLMASGFKNPALIRAGWDDLGAVLRDQLNRCLEAYLAGPGPRCLVTAITKAIGDEVDLRYRWTLRRYYLWLDVYLRARARWHLVMALVDRPLLVVGEGWEAMAEDLRGRRTAVRFRRPTSNLAETYQVLGRTQLCLHDCTAHHGSHERVLRAMAAGAAALTNRTGWFTDHAPAHGLVQLDFEREDVTAAVDDLLSNPSELAAIAARGHLWQGQGHTWQHRIDTLESLIATLGSCA